jgi:ZIP family zinc transporter
MWTYTFIPVAAAVIGAMLAAWRAPDPRLSSAIQHFAAGIVFAAAAGELLPDLVHQH